jgi:pyridoxamine 5'-phosphate oxidase
MSNHPRDLRREYIVGELTEITVDRDPFAQFERWFNEAVAAGVVEPNAMTLATADGNGAPSARVVLLKGFDRRGFVFFGNYNSRKGRELLENPRAALCIHWQPLERQVRIEGTVTRVSREESDEYFHLRPIESQISAVASPQSQRIKSREELQRRMDELKQKYAGQLIPLPDHWGGWRLAPMSIEFWQGRAARLHDRLLYTLNDGGAGWTMERLAP